MSSWTARAAGAGGSHVAPGCHDQCAGVPLGEQGRAGKQVREERAGMCGITGWVDYRRDLTEERDIIAAMSATMECRGPDAGGIWCAPHAAIGHRRLSVIDIEGGIQPMLAGRDPDVVLTFSGEIYNFRELRRELASYGHAFRTRSDTEVLLRAWLQWGARCVSRLNGMFAFAVWDAESQELVLVRDRMGIKPLYYARLPDGAVFGSEPKAILAHPQVAAELDAEGIAERQLVADVPLCTLLSGGLASSTLTAMAAGSVRRHGGNALATFSVDFAGRQHDFRPDRLPPSHDEPYARRVAEHVGSRHRTILLDAADLAGSQWEPLAARDLPATGEEYISAYLLFRAVREHAVVALSGESADEVFGGYR